MESIGRQLEIKMPLTTPCRFKMHWECKTKGSPAATMRFKSRLNWFLRIHCAFQSEFYLLNKSVVRLWHVSGYRSVSPNYKCIYSLSVEMGGMCRCPLKLEQNSALAARCSQVLAQSSNCQVTRNTWELRPVITRQACTRASTNLPATYPAGVRKMQNNSSANSSYVMWDFKEHPVTCYCISRFWHLSIFAILIVKKKEH